MSELSMNSVIVPQKIDHVLSLGLVSILSQAKREDLLITHCFEFLNMVKALKQMFHAFKIVLRKE